MQPLSAVIKGYFVQIFGLCIAAKNGTGPEKDLAETVLYESLLQLGEISEFERDNLIRKHMVCFLSKPLPFNLHAMFAVPLCIVIFICCFHLVHLHIHSEVMLFVFLFVVDFYNLDFLKLLSVVIHYRTHSCPIFRSPLWAFCSQFHPLLANQICHTFPGRF